jgi:hypothetical protein
VIAGWGRVGVAFDIPIHYAKNGVSCAATALVDYCNPSRSWTTDQSASPAGRVGAYYYALTPNAAGLWWGVVHTSSDVDQKDIAFAIMVAPADETTAGIAAATVTALEAMLASAVTTSGGFFKLLKDDAHTAADVWAVGTRTLTSFGTLVADVATAVWGAGTRTLTSFGTLAADVWAVSSRTLTSFGTLAADTATDVWAAGTRTLTSFGTLAADAASAVWASGTRTLTSFGTLAADVAALVGSDLWSTLTATLTTVGSVGKLMVDKFALIGTGTVTTVYPLSADGLALTLKIGDSYSVAGGNAISWASDDWRNDLQESPTPTLVRFVARSPEGVQKVSATVNVTGARAVRLELTTTQTAAIRAAGTYVFDVEASWDDGRVETLVSNGTLVAEADQAR